MKRLPAKLYAALCLGAALFPAHVVPGYYGAPGRAALWLLTAAAGALLGALTVLVPGRWRIPWALAGIAALAALFPPALLPAGALVVLLSLITTPRAPGEEWPQPYWLAGLGFGLAGQAWAFFLTRGGPPAAVQAQGWLRAGYALYIGLFVLNLNRASLADGVTRHTREKPPRTVRLRNIWLSMGCVALLYALAAWRQLAAWASGAAAALARAVAAVLAWLNGLFRPAHVSGAGGGRGGMEAGMLPAAEGAMFWVILEKIAMVLTYAALAALTVFGLYRLLRKLWAWLRSLRRRLLDAANALGENYVSRTESVFDWQEVRQAAAQRVRALRPFRKRPPKWSELDDRQRVRRGYAVLRARRSDVPASLTARQALSGHVLVDRDADGGALADAYDAARYSDLPILPGQAEAMRIAARIKKQ